MLGQEAAVKNSFPEELEIPLSASERELLGELLRTLRSVRYGSVNLTIHDGRLVEIEKVEKIRPATGKAKG